MNLPAPPPLPIRFYIPTSTIIKLAFAALIIVLVMRLAPLLSLILISVILAVSVQSLLKRIEHRIPRSLAIGLIGVGTLAITLLLGFVILPPLITQISAVAAKAPEFLRKNLQHYPHGQEIYASIETRLKSGMADNASSWLQGALGMGHVAFESFSDLVIVFVFFIYLLVDGPRAYRWFLAFFNDENKRKLEQTSHEISQVMSAYIFGQIITSALASLYVFVALKALGVPAALMLAVLAGVFDALPVLGFFIALIPAVIFAMTVSSQTALIVVGLYILYHIIENYLILPIVYGNRLRLSGLVVLFSFLAAGLTAGIIGALLILPIVASYHIIEKFWLAKYLQPTTVANHAQDDQIKSRDHDE